MQQRLRGGKKVIQLTCCRVEIGEGLFTNVAVSEEHSELTTAQTGPKVFEENYKRVSEGQKYGAFSEHGSERDENCLRGQWVLYVKEDIKIKSQLDLHQAAP